MVEVKTELTQEQSVALTELTLTNLMEWRERVLHMMNQETREIERTLLGAQCYISTHDRWVRGPGKQALRPLFNADLARLNDALGKTYSSWEEVDGAKVDLEDCASIDITTVDPLTIAPSLAMLTEQLFSGEENDVRMFRAWVCDTYTSAFHTTPRAPLRSEILKAKRRATKRDEDASSLVELAITRRIRRYHQSSFDKDGGLDLLNDQWGTAFSMWSTVMCPSPDNQDAIESLQKRVVEDIGYLKDVHAAHLQVTRTLDWGALEVTTLHARVSAVICPGETGDPFLDWWLAVSQCSSPNIHPSRWYTWYLGSLVRLREKKMGETIKKKNGDRLQIQWLQQLYTVPDGPQQLCQEWGIPLLNWCDVEAALPESITWPVFETLFSTHTQEAKANYNAFVKAWPGLDTRFCIQPTTSNGNCLFDAVAIALNCDSGHDSMRAAALRQTLVESLPLLRDIEVPSVTYVWPEDSVHPGWEEQRPGFVTPGWQVFSDTPNNTITSLQRQMLSTNWWGTHDAMRVLSAILGVRFIVLNSRGCFDCVGATVTSSTRYILLYYHEHRHYELVVGVGVERQTVFELAELPQQFVEAWRESCGAMDDSATVTPVFIERRRW